MDMASDWQVETMRITVFPSDISAVSLRKLWDSVVDKEPDASHYQREMIDSHEIKFGNGRIVLAKQTDRIDWHYLSIPDSAHSVQLPVIGKLKEELSVFTDLANACFDSTEKPSIKRLAFGAVLLRPVNTVEEGNSILADMLPNMNLKGARDFYYQVNRRRNSKIDPGIEVNRLSKWNVFSGQLVAVAVNPMQGQHVTTTTGLSIASRLELDINTAPERIESLPTDKLREIFRELIDLGLEIYRGGDVA